MIHRSQIKFHETFQPEAGYLAKILGLASNNYSGSKFEISEKTGIPTGKQKGKVEPHIKYAAFMGLLSYACEKGKYQISLTDLGREVYVQDPYLHETLTKWLCHYGISRKEYGAPQWSFLIHDGNLGFIQGISPERIMSQASSIFESNVTFDEAFSVLRRSYMNGFFAELHYLTVEEDSGEYHFIESYEKDEFLYLYAYAILNNWDARFPDQSEITVLELMEDLSFGKQFGLTDDSVGEVLEKLSEEGIIAINRQLYPATMIRTSTVNQVIPLLYSKLL